VEKLTRGSIRPVLATLVLAALVLTVLTELLAGTAAAQQASRRYVPAKRILELGMRGHDVYRMQKRLAELKYYLGRPGGVFNQATLEAVWAFQEVAGIRSDGLVGRLTEHALVHPRAPRPLVGHGGALRVEIDLGRHVLVVYHRNRIALISHISAGGGYYYCSGGSCSHAITPTGNFRTTFRISGWDDAPLGMLYNPVFFLSDYAIHGEAYVPLQPVSHGCVRIPMDVAGIFPRLVPRSRIPVYIRK
jgi:hypothetical protein